MTSGNTPAKALDKTDVAVIGAGPGGYVAAIRLAQLGKQVVVIEREAPGGVCLNWGCIPSKALIHAAGVYDKIRSAHRMGIHVDNLRLDMVQLQNWKEEVVRKLTGGITQLFKAHRIELIRGEASFLSPKTLEIQRADGSKQSLEADAFLIATGSSPIALPQFPFNGRTIVESREALSWTAVPETLAVVGGGVIGVEMASLYAKLGSRVTLIEMAPALLADTDEELVRILHRALKKRGVEIFTDSRLTRAEVREKNPQEENPREVEPGEAQVILSLDTPQGPQIRTVDKLLLSIGRKPNSSGLGLEKIGVHMNEKGFISVDSCLRTSVPHIFAIGDVTAPPLLAHKASKEGLVAAAVIAGQNEILDYRAMPAAIFSDPEIATVGLSEAQAQAEGRQVKVGRFPFAASGRAMSMNATEGLIKLIADAETDQLLGAHMVGPDVSELIAEAALGIEMGATAEDIALTVHAHPTLPESLMEAAEAVHGLAVHIPPQDRKTLLPV